MNKLIFIPDSKTLSGRRKIPMSDRATAILSARCSGRDEGWVFPSKRSGAGHLTTISKLFRQARNKAGLPNELVLYCSRHDYGTRVLRGTGNLAAVMKTMGHKDVRTAMRYQDPELGRRARCTERNANDEGFNSFMAHFTAHYDLCRNQKLGM